MNTLLLSGLLLSQSSSVVTNSTPMPVVIFLGICYLVMALAMWMLVGMYFLHRLHRPKRMPEEVYGMFWPLFLPYALVATFILHMREKIRERKEREEYERFRDNYKGSTSSGGIIIVGCTRDTGILITKGCNDMVIHGNIVHPNTIESPVDKAWREHKEVVR